MPPVPREQYVVAQAPEGVRTFQVLGHTADELGTVSRYDAKTTGSDTVTCYSDSSRPDFMKRTCRGDRTLR